MQETRAYFKHRPKDSNSKVNNAELQKVQNVMKSYLWRDNFEHNQNKVKPQNKLVLASSESKKQVFIVIESDKKT